MAAGTTVQISRINKPIKKEKVHRLTFFKKEKVHRLTCCIQSKHFCCNKKSNKDD